MSPSSRARGRFSAFSFLAAQFDYPTILDGSAAEVLPRLRSTGATGVGTAVAGLAGMLRNATDVVAPIGSVNTYLLPLWMAIFGGGLLRVSGDAPERGVPDSSTQQTDAP